MSSGAMPTRPDNNSDESNNQQDNSNTQQNSNNVDEVAPNKKLGIIVTRPKEPEYAFYEKRKASFKEWPRIHGLKPEELAEAGYFYIGVSDKVRCFYCFGGLRRWKSEEDVWVEHARWFPKCGYLQQEKGSDFVDAVQDLKKELVEQEIPEEKIKITLDDVNQRMKDTNTFMPRTFKDRVIERDAAVLTVIDSGYDGDEIYKLALEKRKNGELLSSDKLWVAAQEKQLPRKDTGNDLEYNTVVQTQMGEEKSNADKEKFLREENWKLRQQTTCKMCLTAEVDVVLLPCGHFVSCRECVLALRIYCPVCRKKFKGTVLANLG